LAFRPEVLSTRAEADVEATAAVIATAAKVTRDKRIMRGSSMGSGVDA
jgi:hypothetical protein